MSTKFKESGTWKDVTDSFIKVAGKWEKSNKSFIKVGGHWSDASNLAATKLSYDGTTATDTDGTRYLVNSVEPTTHKAPLHSGEAVTLSGDGKIEVPINQGQGSVTVFDHKTKTFTQPALPLASTYTLKDGTFGTIIKLDTNTFSQADLTAFTARPELVLEWNAGTATIPSAIVKGAKDVVYNANGLALPVVLGAERIAPITDTSFLTSKCSIVKVGDKVTMTATSAGTVFMYLPFRTASIKTIADGANVLATYSYVSSSNTARAHIYKNHKRPRGVSGEESFIFQYSDTDTFYYRFDIESATVGDTLEVDISKLSLKEITSAYLPITGTHTTINTSQFGIQQIKVGTGAMNGKDDGRYIDIPMVGGHKHLLKTCTKLIAGDITQVTDTPC